MHKFINLVNARGSKPKLFVSFEIFTKYVNKNHQLKNNSQIFYCNFRLITSSSYMLMQMQVFIFHLAKFLIVYWVIPDCLWNISPLIFMLRDLCMCICLHSIKMMFLFVTSKICMYYPLNTRFLYFAERFLLLNENSVIKFSSAINDSKLLQMIII